MSDMNLTPELTLSTDAAAAQMPAAPVLTLGGEPAAAQTAEQEREANAVKVDESMLTEAERKMVDEFAKKIDVTDSNLVMQYGAAAQKNIAAFSENALNNVRTKDLGEVRNVVKSAVSSYLFKNTRRSPMIIPVINMI